MTTKTAVWIYSVHGAITTITVPSDLDPSVAATVLAWGGSQGGEAVPAGVFKHTKGGDAADHANATAMLTPSAVLACQLGRGGDSGTVTLPNSENHYWNPANGEPGTDTWLKTGGGSYIVLARGGASATVSNIGTNIFTGGLGSTTALSGSLGGGAGGGAAGPHANGSNGGDYPAGAATVSNINPAYNYPSIAVHAAPQPADFDMSEANRYFYDYTIHLITFTYYANWWLGGLGGGGADGGTRGGGVYTTTNNILHFGTSRLIVGGDGGDGGGSGGLIAGGPWSDGLQPINGNATGAAAGQGIGGYGANGLPAAGNYWQSSAGYWFFAVYGGSSSSRAQQGNASTGVPGKQGAGGSGGSISYSNPFGIPFNTGLPSYTFPDADILPLSGGPGGEGGLVIIYTVLSTPPAGSGRRLTATPRPLPKTATVVPPPAPPPPPSSGGAVHFDGTALMSTASLSVTDAAAFSCSFWYKGPVILFNGTSVGTTNAFIATDASGATVFAGNAALSGFGSFTVATPATTWHSVVFSMDTTTSTAKFYLDDVDVTGSATGGFTGAPFTPGLNGLQFHVGGNALVGDLAEVWIAPGVSLLVAGDIPLATRRQFITGTGHPAPSSGWPAAAIKLSGNATGFLTNQGTGGAFTISGSLTDASTSP